MSAYRLALQSLECVTPRSADPYTDHVAIALVARQGDRLICEKGSLYGNGAGSRALLNFGPGTTRPLTPTFWGEGTDIAWDVPFDFTNSKLPVEIGLAIVNVRDVGDPYLLARVLLYLGAAALTAGVTTYFGKDIKEAAAKILSDDKQRNALLDLLGEVKEVVLPDWLFNWDWPSCGGEVLVWSTVITPEDVTQRIGPVDIHNLSDGARPVSGPERGCRQPVYRVRGQLAPDGAFGETRVPVRSQYVPETKSDAMLWVGNWRRWQKAGCQVVVGEPHNRHYDVDGSEYVGTIEAAIIHALAVRESLQDWTHHGGDHEAHALNENALPTSASGVLGGVRVLASAAQWATPTTNAAAALGHGTRAGIGSTATATATTTAPAPLPAEAPSSIEPMSDLVGVDSGLQLLARNVRTLTLPGDVRLGLYKRIEVFEDGPPETTGPYVRYMRPGKSRASAADYMLFNQPEVK